MTNQIAIAWHDVCIFFLRLEMHERKRHIGSGRREKTEEVTNTCRCTLVYRIYVAILVDKQMRMPYYQTSRLAANRKIN